MKPGTGGAKFGSIWTAACLAGGFLGAYLADYYTLPVASLIGNFYGSAVVAKIIIFVGSVMVVLIPAAYVAPPKIVRTSAHGKRSTNQKTVVARSHSTTKPVAKSVAGKGKPKFRREHSIAAR